MTERRLSRKVVSMSSISIRPTDMVPVLQWLDEVRGRVDGWSKGVRAASAEEWKKFHKAITQAISVTRVEGVLRDFLGRIGMSSKTKSNLAEEMVLALRMSIIHYREGETIESYQNFLTDPPNVRL